MTELELMPSTSDPWQQLKQFTPARIALGRAGMSQTTQACLQFQLAHALARDAVNLPLNFPQLAGECQAQGYPTICLQSQAANQAQFLQRPDLGRLLCSTSVTQLQQCPVKHSDAVIVIADGLSSSAIAKHALAFVNCFFAAAKSMHLTFAPLCLMQHGRVAIADAVAEHFSARFCILLIGERPGLSSPDSLGIYFSYQAKAGITTDADRNCLSNIHQHGMSYQQAASKLLYLMQEAEKRQYSGVNLKDETVDISFNQSLQHYNFATIHPKFKGTLTGVVKV
jgi:ethanolamine ammonia-lyase small subunit